ncbi:MAG: glycoside hydrolase family 97 N-terminal domain-containing protein, partial [Alistipes sp.]|nr:glycoside hydrolase family 97 N-terminal domain-containing protein [Alistipes sp.]
MKRIFLTIATLLCGVVAIAQSITSPDGNLVATFRLADGGVPTYTLTYKGKEVIKPSRLGFEFVDNAYKTHGTYCNLPERPIYSMREGFSLVGTENGSFDETWAPVWGENSKIRNHYNELLVKLCRDERGFLVNIRFRIYDD